MIATAVAIVAVTAASSCGQDEAIDDASDELVTESDAEAGDSPGETRFVLTSSEAPDIVEGATIEITLGGDQLSAYAGCNRIFGQYRLEGTTLIAGPLASTRMACERELMDQDAWLIRFLESEPELVLDDDEMVLSGSLGRMVLSSESSSPDVETDGDAPGDDAAD